MNIETISQDLVTRLKTVSAYNNRVGLTVGGKEIDPFNRDLPRPAAWALYVGDDNNVSSPMNPCASLVQMNFVVKILVDYDNESNLTSIHLPLLHATAAAIHGGEPVKGMKWVYEGQGLESLDPDRMVWAQNYTILTGLS